MCYNSLRSLIDLVNVQVELSVLPELTSLRKSQVASQASLAKATESLNPLKRVNSILTKQQI